jgi:hypothetical protein
LSPQQALTGLAVVAALQEQPERAARLAGAVAARCGAASQPGVQRKLEAGFLEPARLRWGPDRWDAAVRQGAVLSLQEATVYALGSPPVRDRHRPSTTPAAGRAD